VVVADGNGGLSANTSAIGGGGTIAASNSGKRLTITGTLAQVDADLTALADDDATTTADTITVNASDSFGNTASPAKSIPVTVTPETNATPPMILGTLAGQTTTDEVTIRPLSGVTITDTNASATERVTLTLTNSSGAATDANGSLSGTGITKTGTGIYTLTVGSPLAVSSQLQALVFTPTAHEVTPGQATTTGITISDYDGSFTTTNKTTSIIAKAVNDAPVITGTQADQTTTDYVAINPFRNAVVTDVDVNVEDSLTIMLKSSSGVTTDANGALSGTGLSKAGVGTYTLAASTPTALTAELEALTFAPAQHEVAAGKTVTTSFTLTASQTAGGSTVTATNTTTSVVVTALNYIFGPTGGFGLLIGTPGQDVITAYGQFNVIYGEGGPDTIIAGNGHANVNVDDGSTTVTLGGSNNIVQGSNGNNTISGAPGGSSNVSLGNGNNVVQIAGNADYIVLGNGNNVISGGQGMEFISTGSGNDTITVGGSGNQVNSGGGTNVINGGTGNDTFVLPPAGLGFDTITSFTELNGDVLDLRSALAATGWNGKSSTLGNYLKVTDSNGNTTLAIASNGTGAGTAIAALNGSGNLGLTDLLSHHSLLT
jgi:plastocyanin